MIWITCKDEERIAVNAWKTGGCYQTTFGKYFIASCTGTEGKVQYCKDSACTDCLDYDFTSGGAQPLGQCNAAKRYECSASDTTGDGNTTKPIHVPEPKSSGNMIACFSIATIIAAFSVIMS